MKNLIISDIHNNIGFIESLIDYVKPNKTIFLGDELDSWGDTVEINRKTAEWMKFSVNQPDRIHLLANHTAAYAFSHNPLLYCSGFTSEKCEAINSVLSHEDWVKFKLVHFEDNFIFSHAGVTRYCFEHPIYGITQQIIEDKCKEALEIAQAGMVNPIWGMEYYRGLYISKPGITWIRWNELDVIKGWNQCVGHTIHDSPQIKYLLNESKFENFNICLDTNNRHYGVLENGAFSFYSTKTKEKLYEIKT